MVAVRKLDASEDFRKLISLFNKIFDNQFNRIPENAYLKSLIEQQNFLVFAAFIEDESVGGWQLLFCRNTITNLHRYIYMIRQSKWLNKEKGGSTSNF